MSTRIGFYMFLGLILGAVIGNWLPFAASLEAVAGGVLAVLVGVLVDRKAPENQEDSAQSEE